jgi:hypothetical protein
MKIALSHEFATPAEAMQYSEPGTSRPASAIATTPGKPRSTKSTGSAARDRRHTVASRPQDQANVAAASDSHTRVKRENGKFRESGGGDALARYSGGYLKFDQSEYKSLYSPSGLCQGITYEVMHRIDMDGRGLMNAVDTLRDNLNRNDRGTHDRITAYQGSQHQMQLDHYEPISPGPTLFTFGADKSEVLTNRKSLIERMVGEVADRLLPGGMAFLGFDAYRPSSTSDSPVGAHSILVQRDGDGHYAIFCPNSGGFPLANVNRMTSALTDYALNAFSQRGLELVPHASRYFAMRSPLFSPSAAPSATGLPSLDPRDPGLDAQGSDPKR